MKRDEEVRLLKAFCEEYSERGNLHVSDGWRDGVMSAVRSVKKHPGLQLELLDRCLWRFACGASVVAIALTFFVSLDFFVFSDMEIALWMGDPSGTALEQVWDYI